MPRLVLVAGLAALLSVPAAQAGVYRCTGADGKVLYSNEPCEEQGAKTAKTFKKSELKPNSVKMPKAPPPEEEKSEGPGGLIGALRGKPLDQEAMIREGDPDKHPKGKRNPILDKLLGKP